MKELFENHPASDPVQIAGDYLSLPSQETAVAWGERAARRVLDSVHDSDRGSQRRSAKLAVPQEEEFT